VALLLDGSHEEHYVVDNLDVVPWRQSLDVTVLKDRLAVKQKGKRQTAAVQCKLNTAHHAQVSLATSSVASFYTELVKCVRARVWWYHSWEPN